VSSWSWQRGIRIVRGRRLKVLRRDGRQGRQSPLGRLLIRLRDGEIDPVAISSMTPMSAAVSRKWAELVENRSRFRRQLSLIIELSQSLLPAADKFRIVQP